MTDLKIRQQRGLQSLLQKFDCTLREVIIAVVSYDNSEVIAADSCGEAAYRDVFIEVVGEIFE